MAYKIEADVQRFYQNQLEKLPLAEKIEVSTKLFRNINTDGYILIDNLHLVLCEFKDHFNFKEKNNLAIALIQALYYMHEFKTKTINIPEIIFIGDEKEYFITSTKFLIENFLDENPEDRLWSAPPSDAWRRCPKLVEKLANTVEYSNMKSHGKEVENGKINKDYISNVINQIIKNFERSNAIKQKLNKDTFKDAYNDVFTKEVLFIGEGDQRFEEIDKILLFKDIVMKEGQHKLNKRDEYLEFDGKKFPVKVQAYNGFRAMYSIRYNKSERHEIENRILELYNDRERVEKSAFPKEKVIVDYAHKMMTKHLGKNWRDEYIVWDPRCYTGNLTKDYYFKNLYLSNPFEKELKLLTTKNYKDAF